RPDRPSASSEETSTTTPLDLPLAPRESTRIPPSDPAQLSASGNSADPPVQRAMDASAGPPTHLATEPVTDAATRGRTELPVNPVSALPLVQRSLIQRAPALPFPASAGEEFLAPTLPSPARGGGELQASRVSGGEEFLAPTQPSPARGGSELQASRASEGDEFLAPTLPTPAPGGGGFLAPTTAALPARERGELRGELAPLVSARPLRPTTLQWSTELPPADLRSNDRLADLTSTQQDEIVLPSP